MRSRAYEEAWIINIESLAAFGANVEEGLQRCMGNEALYLRLTESLKTNGGFDDLKYAIDEGRLEDAFEAAHALKGALGNLSITPLYEPMSEITELLRHQEEADYPALVDAIMQKQAEFCTL